MSSVKTNSSISGNYFSTIIFYRFLKILPRKKFDTLYKNIDINGDGEIGIDEFIIYCKRRVRKLRKTKIGVDSIAVEEFEVG